jgi:hypothetical protein
MMTLRSKDLLTLVVGGYLYYLRTNIPCEISDLQSPEPLTAYIPVIAQKGSSGRREPAASLLLRACRLTTLS